VAACALIAFGHLASELRYIEAAERCVRLFAPILAESPGGCSTLLAALSDLESPPVAVLIDGAVDEALRWQQALETRYRPSVRIFNVAGVAAPRPRRQRRTTGRRAPSPACHGTRCLPIATLAQLERELDVNVMPSAALEGMRAPGNPKRARGFG
jgi:uncharacterized protein YyaL (SSP411 family)